MVGVCTAYFLAEAGHDVVVIDRNQNVAQEASFANAALLAPGHCGPWATPGMTGRLLRGLWQAESAVTLKPGLDHALWRWLRRWRREGELERFRINKARMQRVAFYSRDLMEQLRDYYQLEYERTQGLLQIFRSQRELKAAEPVIALLAEHGVPHQLMNHDDARAVEPALATHTEFAAALHLPQDEAGNCPLFARRMKQITETLGAQFHLATAVEAIEPESRGLALRINGERFPVDAAVIAAGAQSAALLKPLGINVPLQAVHGYSITAMVHDYERAPHGSVFDETYRTSVSRMGGRVRVAGTAGFGANVPALQQRAVRTLLKVASDWFPQAAPYASANPWSGLLPMLPDGPPLLGPTHIPGLYLNIGHGTEGWAMAAGSGKVVADIVSGREPEIDLEGLTLKRYG